jgi:hypothetical protein
MKKATLILLTILSLYTSLYSQQSKEVLFNALVSNMDAHLNLYYENLNPLQVDDYFAAINANPNNIHQINITYLGEPAAMQLQTITSNTLTAANNLSTHEIDLAYAKNQLGGDDPYATGPGICRAACGAIGVLTALAFAGTPPPADVFCMYGVYVSLIKCLYDCNQAGPMPPGGGFPSNPPTSWAH